MNKADRLAILEAYRVVERLDRWQAAYGNAIDTIRARGPEVNKLISADVLASEVHRLQLQEAYCAPMQSDYFQERFARFIVANHSPVVAKSWSVEQRANKDAMFVTHPDGSQDYNPNMPIERFLLVTLADDSTEEVPISLIEAEGIYSGFDVEDGEGSLGGSRTREILRNAGFSFAEPKNPEAEDFVDEHGATFITTIDENGQQSVVCVAPPMDWDSPADIQTRKYLLEDAANGVSGWNGLGDRTI